MASMLKLFVGLVIVLLGYWKRAELDTCAVLVIFVGLMIAFGSRREIINEEEEVK